MKSKYFIWSKPLMLLIFLLDMIVELIVNDKTRIHFYPNNNVFLFV